MRAIVFFIRRTVRAMRLVAGDRRIPRPLRWLAGLAFLPIPGPFDEAVLLLVAVPLFVFYRRPLRDAWRLAEAARQAGDDGSAGDATAPMTAEVIDGDR
jgi:hypothetical protein